MPRPRKDGEPARPARHRRLTEMFVRRVRPEAYTFNAWDLKQAGLVLRVQATGARAWKVVYRHAGRPRWFHIGDARAIGLSDARRMAAGIMLKAAEGKDPAAERKAARGAGTFAELAERYLVEHAKKKNKSWRQADALVRRYLLPRWAKLQAKNVTRSDVRAVMTKIEAPVLANQVLAAASAIFSWAVKQEIVELIRGSILKAILLTGQRPGEVSHMRHEHIDGGWWTLPGKPDPKLQWNGTKNGESHRVWLPQAVRDIVAEVTGEGAVTGFVFAGPRGAPVDGLDGAMRAICVELGVNEKATPHDLRRTHGTTITKLKFGRDAMNRIQNHKEGGIADVYDIHDYAEENKRVMEAVAARILAIAEGRAPADNVVSMALR
jgi:integrase